MTSKTDTWTIRDAGLGFSVFTSEGVFLAWYYTRKDCENMIARHKARGI
jgi:hypothetical protein